MTDITSLCAVSTMGRQTLRSIEKSIGVIASGYSTFDENGSGYKSVPWDATKETRALFCMGSGIMSVILLSNQAMASADISRPFIHLESATSLHESTLRSMQSEAIADFFDPPSFDWSDSIYASIQASQKFIEPL